MGDPIPEKARVWRSDNLSYLVWRYAPLALLLLFVFLFGQGALQEPDPAQRLAIARRVAPLLFLLGLWALWALLYIANVYVVEGEEGIRVRRGRSEVSYPWHLLHSLGSIKLKTTRFWRLKVDGERSIIFCTDAPAFGPEREPGLIQQIRPHLAEGEHRR